MQPANANARGAVALMLAMAAFVLNDALMKRLSEVMPVSEALLLRGVMTTIVMGSLLPFMAPGGLRLLLRPHVIYRSLFEAASAFTFITAISHLPLADVTAITMASPLLITVIAALWFKESVGWRRWLAVLVGFAGTVIIIRPGASGIDPYALLAVICVFVVAGRDVMTRRIGFDVPVVVIALGASVSITLISAALSLSGAYAPWVMPDAHATLMLVGTAVFVMLGNVFVVHAFRGVELSAVAPFRYTVIVWALLLGWFFWGHTPDLWAFVGMALVIGSGLYTLHREAIRRREARIADALAQAAEKP